MDAEIILLVIKTLPQEKTLGGGGGGGGNVKSLRPYVVYPFRIRLSIKVALESGFVVVVNC